MASGGKKQQDDEESGSWFSTGLKFGAALGAAALTTYAAVKIAQNVAKEKEPPSTRGYSGGSFEDVGGRQASYYSDALSQRGESYFAHGGSSEPKRKPSGSVTYGGNNMGSLWSYFVGGSVLEEEEPWCLSSDGLETWYNKNIRDGTDAFAKDCGSAIENVVKHIHKNCSANILDFNVDKVVKGGSVGKGTMVKDLSDVDLVAFVNKPYLKPIAEIGKEEYKKTLSRIISDITSTLQDEPDVEIIRENQFLVNFKIQVGSRWIEVDLLPTTDNAKSHQPDDEMFRSMLEVGNGTRQLYSASFVQNQVKFVKKQPGHVKELIRLVKYWASKFLPKGNQKSYYKGCQKSYPLELITIYRWEKAGKPGRHMRKAQGLRSVLEVLTNLEQLCASWQYLHSDKDLAETAMVKLDMERPIVLDPANPTNNVCWAYKWSKEVFAAAAERTLQTALLRNVTAWPYLRE